MSLPDPWTMTVCLSEPGAEPNNGAAHGPPDWLATKRAILAGLDVAAEFVALGVEFTKPSANGKGLRECRAVGRADESPSAFVNLETGVYHDSGGEGKTFDLFNFALEYGSGFGRWIDAIKHYAGKAGVAIGKVQTKSGGRILEDRYDYREATGEVRYGVFRYRLPTGKKDFTQHPTDGKGGWKYGDGCMEGVDPLPYRLPELLAAPTDETVWIVEGEKDCRTLAALGLVATTNHGGANVTAKRWPHLVEYLRGRSCVVIPDHDVAGWGHALGVAGFLKGVASSVKVVELPGLGPRRADHGLDVSDWLDDANTVEVLGRLAYAAPEWEPGAGDQPGPEGEGLDEHPELPPDADVVMVQMSDVTAVEVEWLWPDCIPIGKVTILAGQAKQGKSFLTMDVAARVSAGLEIPGREGECFEAGSVVLLSAEDDLDDTVKPRLDAAGADTSRIHALTTVRKPDGTLGPFTLAEMGHLERAIVRTPGTRLVIIDPVTHYVGGKVDDNKVTQLRALLGPLKLLAARCRVAVLLVTHMNKGTGVNALNRVIGSSAYTALARSNWFVVKDPKDPKRRMMLDAGNNLVEDPTGLAFRIVGGKLEWESEPLRMTASEALQDEQDEEKETRKEKTATPKKSEQARVWLVERLAVGDRVLSETLLTEGEAKGLRRNALFDAKKELGIWAEKSREKNGAWVWFWPPAPPVEQGQAGAKEEEHWDDSPF